MDFEKLKQDGNVLLADLGLLEWNIVTRFMKALGRCDYDRRELQFNTEYVINNPDEEVWDTFKHEVAHALTPGHKHDAVWRAQAEALGCSARATRSLAHMPESHDHKATCPKCGHTYWKGKPRYKSGYYCPTCGPVNGALHFEKE